MSDRTRRPATGDDFTPWTADERRVADDNKPLPGVDELVGEPASAIPVSPAEPTAPADSPAALTSDVLGEAPAVFIDSSAIVALVDQDDASHQDAVTAYHGLVSAGYRLFTTNYVVSETYDLLRAGVGHAVARQWLKDNALATYHADEQDERRARRTVLRARGAHGLTITDAISLVVMERFGVADAFAVDPNFLSGGE